MYENCRILVNREVDSYARVIYRRTQIIEKSICDKGKNLCSQRTAGTKKCLLQLKKLLFVTFLL